jgi:hypothetical protein
MGIRPRPALTAAAAIPLALLAACSSASGLSASQVAADRAGGAPALLVQCLLSRGLMQPPAGLDFAGGQPWLQGTRLSLTTSDSQTEFHQWVTSLSTLSFAGEQFQVWVTSAQSTGRLPAALCGASASAPAALFRQVYGVAPPPGVWLASK